MVEEEASAHAQRHGGCGGLPLAFLLLSTHRAPSVGGSRAHQKEHKPIPKTQLPGLRAA